MAYDDNTEHKNIIDCVLERNAILFMNLGIDSPRSEYQKAKVIENQNLMKVRYIDSQKIDRLTIS